MNKGKDCLISAEGWKQIDADLQDEMTLALTPQQICRHLVIGNLFLISGHSMRLLPTSVTQFRNAVK